MPNKEKLRERGVLVPAISALILALTGIEASAQDVADVDVKIGQVALFKNGMGYFTSSANLPKGASDFRIKQLPVPSHGTFWVTYPEDMKFLSLIASKENVDEIKPARSIAQLLQYNLGRNVTVSTAIPDMRPIRGTIVNVIWGSQPTESLSTYYPDARRSYSTPRNLPAQPTSLVVIQTESGNVVLKGESITSADFQEDSIVTSVTSLSSQPSIRIELEEASKGQQIGISYLAWGITWSPSYLIDISDSKTAKLSAQAVVINEAADLRDIHLDLVTGFPNIRFGEVNSPLAMSQDLAGFLRSLTTGRNELRGSGSMMTSNVMTAQAGFAGLGFTSDAYGMPSPVYPAAPEGIVSEDLYLYPVESFTLNRGETACLPLFTAEVPYKHIYIWDIADRLDENERYRQAKEKDENLLAEEVWHSCRLVNNMDMPWTTAAAEFIKDGQFTGQDICYYTPPGAETTIRLNRALNIVAEQTELELERERSAAHFYGYSHDLVRVKGELKLKNRSDKSVNVEVTKNLSGEVLESVPQAGDTTTAKGLRMVNPRHVLLWKIELKAGQEQMLSYTYEVYVRN